MDYLHASAFGFGVTKDKIDELNQYCNDKLKNMVFTAAPFVDFEFDMDADRAVTKLQECLKTIGSLNELGFWGQGIKEPLIAIKNIRINKMDIYKKKTITGKITGNGDIQYMKFNANENELLDLQPKGFQTSYIDVIGRVNVNQFYNKITYQVFIDNYQKIIYNNNIKTWNF